MEAIQEIGSVKDRLAYLFNSKINDYHDLIRILVLSESHAHVIINGRFYYNNIGFTVGSINQVLLDEFEKFTVVDMKRNVVICIDDILKPIDKKCIEDLDIENIYR